jgi:predicted glutamine amidotransferase
MCNLSGYIGKNPNIDKLKLLLALGRTRGTDSVGININGEVEKAVSKNYLKHGDSLEFIPENYYLYKELVKPGEYNIIMQHNRKKSSGLVKLEAAHPYVIEYEKEDGSKHNLYFMHNGTITNIHQLCRKFGYTASDYETDSEALAYLILENGAEAVLPWYEGGAALVWYYDEDPKTVYMWKGASPKTYGNYYSAYQSTTELEEERPLHYFHMDDGTYFSSLQEHMHAINDGRLNYDENPVYMISNNNLCKFVDGQMVNSKLIERKTIPVAKPKTVASTATNYYSSKTEFNKDFDSSSPANNRISFNGYSYQHEIRRTTSSTFKKADGVYSLDINGYITAASEKKHVKLFYFINGYLIKDADTYTVLREKKANSADLEDVHHLSCWSDMSGNRYYNGQKIEGKLIKPLFSDVYIQIGKYGNFLSALKFDRALREGLLSTDQLAFEFFCDCYHLSPAAAHPYTVNTYAKKDLGWEDFTIDYFRYYLPANKKPHEINQKYKDAYENFMNSSLDKEKPTLLLPTKETKEVKDTKKTKDEERQKFYEDLFGLDEDDEDDLASFNETFKQRFVDKTQANTWYYIYRTKLKYQYNPNWGLDEFWITQYKENSKNYTEGNKKEKSDTKGEKVIKAKSKRKSGKVVNLNDNNYDLPFGYEDSVVAGLEEQNLLDQAEELFLKDYDDLLDKHVEIYNSYYEFNFGYEDNSTKEKWERLDASRKILEGRITIE